MTKDCYWGTKETDAHVSQCLTSCHNPKVRRIVTDELCAKCSYKERPEILERIKDKNTAGGTANNG